MPTVRSPFKFLPRASTYTAANAGGKIALALLLSMLLAFSCKAGVIAETKGLFGTIVVEEDAGMRTLRFARNGARQSVVKIGDPDHLELSYARTMLAGFALSPKVRRILVLGLGGGTLPMFLHKNFPEATVDVVEIDPAVIQVATRYFGVKEDSRLRIHNGDARRFVEASEAGRYDVILVDAFGANSAPAHLTTQEFVRALRAATAPGGLVLGNLWHRPFNAAYDSMLLTYLSVFEQTRVLDAPGDFNSIVLAVPRADPVVREDFVRLAGELTRARMLRIDLGALVTRAFKEVSASALEGKILIDRDLKSRP